MNIQANDPKLKRKYNRFLENYGSNYDEEMYAFIYSYFGEEIDSLGTVYPLMEIYSELGVYGKEDFYLQHVNLIKENFDISGNILEVGAGCFPAFGKKMAIEQLKIKSGTITLYDRDLAIKKPLTKNMRLVKDSFSSATDIKSYDLIVGIMPCEATRIIIERACEERKDFYIALCDCVNDPVLLARDPFLRMKRPEDYHQMIFRIAEEFLDEYDNGYLQIEYMDSKYDQDAPIIYNKRKR